MASKSELSFEHNPKRSQTHYIIKPAGWPSPFAQIDIGRNSCGHIQDGVAIDFTECEDPNRFQMHPGGVISFADLQAIYFAARAYREGNRE